jgi:hypothetical protein
MLKDPIKRIMEGGMLKQDAFDEDEQQLSREFSEWLPKLGDKLIQKTPDALRVDTLGYSDPRTPKARSPIGRWELYSDGFLQAGDLLVESLKKTPADPALIYPILFLYRHHLELELKGRIRYCLSCLSGLDDAEIADKLNRGHNLQGLWSTLKSCYPDYGREMPKASRAFETLLSELSKIDPDSQGARYPVDTKGNQTITNLRCLDLSAFGSAIRKMSHYLRCIHEGIAQDVDWRSEMESW